MLLDMNNLLAIYIHKDPVDLRKVVDGYAVLIQSELERNPLDSSLYLFTNRPHNKIKGFIYNGQRGWLLRKHSIQRSLLLSTLKINSKDDDRSYNR